MNTTALLPARDRLGDSLTALLQNGIARTCVLREDASDAAHDFLVQNTRPDLVSPGSSRVLLDLLDLP
jgi:hypothetical protein